MKRTLIIGARADGHANVVLEILRADKKYDVVGFVDDDVSKLGAVIKGLKVMGTTNELTSLKEDVKIECAIVAIGNNTLRRALSQKILDAGLELINAIHPTACFDSDVTIGKGCYIGQ